ncbi:MAG TPA: murein biosynthesis integral membrane protein MurJ [Gallionella sp.]|nr:murein biosynthesis integral membrane protein MurJ [Gallionella sp.]OGS67293.1 MAG: murein biosynthesis integral membrane protein MurJ [Gallionellales bacterium GWA2_54_124]OGT18020.1 MAG: murein biosynthesis integral membrane protein MurJ [Gallionellales bacterium RIFOXYD12_FULL_53_10]OGT23105.1 MAG: murein biosynthesis integral membrane protein MurJ [Gallionellales bacterium RIFOXYD2_FULL_52_7]HCI52096.1 murein biosynthesis integral membrane protein MurJ [Gallionella sp.]
MNLLRSLATISGLTLVSRILAFARDILIARVFGAGMATDAFFVAFKLPNLLRRLFAEGAFSQAFVPIFGEYRNRRGHEETRRLVDHVATMLAIILFIVTGIGIIAAPVLVYVSAPGFVQDAEKFQLTVQLLRFTSPYIFFISLVAVAAAILNTYNKFWVPAFAPILLNICFIGGALWLAPYCNPPVMALAWSVFIAGIVQLAFQVPFLKKIDMLPSFRFDWKDEGMRRVLRQMGPAIFGVSIAQISLIINTIFASFLVAGSVSWLYYADRLMEFPAGMLGAALGTILLPSLSKCHASQDTVEYSKLLDWGLRLTFMLAVPSALALGMIAVPLLSTFFQRGAFLASDVLMTSHALVGYSIGLIGMILVKILAPGFYARQDIKTPVKIGIVTLIATQVMNALFIGWIAHAGLALSIALGACLNSAILFYFLRKNGIYQPEPGWFMYFAKVGVAVTALALTLWFGMGTQESWLTGGGWERITRLAVLVTGGVVVYFTVLAVLGFRPRDFSRRAIS